MVEMLPMLVRLRFKIVLNGAPPPRKLVTTTATFVPVMTVVAVSGLVAVIGVPKPTCPNVSNGTASALGLSPSPVISIAAAARYWRNLASCL